MLLLISVAPSCCVASAPHQPGGSQELCWIPSSAFLLKLAPEAGDGMEVPTKLEMPPLLSTQGDMENCWVSSLHDLPSFLGVCNFINFSDRGVMVWIYLEFLLLLLEKFCFYFMNQIICHSEFQAQTVCGVFTVFSAEDWGWEQLHDHMQYAVLSEDSVFYINNHHMCLENWCVSKYLFLW